MRLNVFSNVLESRGIFLSSPRYVPCARNGVWHWRHANGTSAEERDN